jgi:hypothetical protein
MQDEPVIGWPLEDALKLISEAYDIYAWLDVNKTTHRSIRLTPENARQWCIEVAGDGFKKIPLFRNGTTIFLGSVEGRI